jgi:hypothetical protein
MGPKSTFLFFNEALLTGGVRGICRTEFQIELLQKNVRIFSNGKSGKSLFFGINFDFCRFLAVNSKIMLSSRIGFYFTVFLD